MDRKTHGMKGLVRNAFGWLRRITASRRGPKAGPAYRGPERRRRGPVIFGGHDRRD